MVVLLTFKEPTIFKLFKHVVLFNNVVYHLTSKEPTIFKLFMHAALFNNVVYPLTFNDDKQVKGLSKTTLTQMYF